MAVLGLSQLKNKQKLTFEEVSSSLFVGKDWIKELETLEVFSQDHKFCIFQTRQQNSYTFKTS